MGAFDDLVVHGIASRVRSGESFDDALRDALPQLRAHRAAANRHDTFWVVGSDEKVADELLTHTFSIEEVDALLLCTDGFARLVDVFRSPFGYENLMVEASRLGLAGLLARLRDQESEPESLVDHPRLGRFDDATMIYLECVDGDTTRIR
jgi:hypothetical protein